MSNQVRFFDGRTLAVVLLAVGVIVGAATPALARLLEPFALLALFVVINLSLVPFARTPVHSLLSLDIAVVRIVAWQLVVLPAIVISAGILARFPDSYIVLTIVTACTGALFASPAFAELLGLDRQRALQGMVLSTLAMPLSLWVFLSMFRTEQVKLDFAAYLERDIVFLLVPFLIFAAYRQVAPTLSEGLIARLDVQARWGTVVALLVFAIGVMRPVTEELASDPTHALALLLVATLVSIVMLGLTIVVMHRYGRREAMTAGLLSSFRNVGLSFALVGDMVGPEIGLYVGVSMLPVFIAPLLLHIVIAMKPELRSAVAAG